MLKDLVSKALNKLKMLEELIVKTLNKLEELMVKTLNKLMMIDLSENPYSSDYCRLNLDKDLYTDSICENIAAQLEDDGVRFDLEYLMEHGYDFSLAIDTLVEDGRLSYL